MKSLAILICMCAVFSCSSLKSEKRDPRLEEMIQKLKESRAQKRKKEENQYILVPTPSGAK